MIFDGIAGNADVKRALAGMAGSGRVPHALMFYENDGCGALLLALGFLECLTGSQKVHKLIHPDIHFIFPVTKGSKVSTDKPTSESYLQYWRELVDRNPYFLENELNDALGIEGKSSVIAIAEAKFIIDKLSFHSLEGGWRAIVVYLPEKMNKDTANRLLKSIEEPPEQTLFLFVTHAPEKVLSTISSRCQGIRVLPLSKEEVAGVLEERFGRPEAEALAAAEVAGGSVGRALAYLSESGEAGAEAALFASLMDALLAKDLLAAQDVGEQLAALPSRERAKAFCRYAAEGLRKIFMLQQGLERIAGAAPAEVEAFADYAARCRKSFPRKALPLLDNALMLIDRNINLKILFCDLVDRLYILI
jgi:DNA polymerase-3 subunit delta'